MAHLSRPTNSPSRSLLKPGTAVSTAHAYASAGNTIARTWYEPATENHLVHWAHFCAGM